MNTISIKRPKIPRQETHPSFHTDNPPRTEDIIPLTVWKIKVTQNLVRGKSHGESSLIGVVQMFLQWRRQFYHVLKSISCKQTLNVLVYPPPPLLPPMTLRDASGAQLLWEQAIRLMGGKSLRLVSWTERTTLTCYTKRNSITKRTYWNPTYIQTANLFLMHLLSEICFYSLKKKWNSIAGGERL